MILRPAAFDWDPDKRDRNVAKHGIDFLDAIRIFEGPVLEWEDTRHRWPEPRMVAVGVIEGRVITVVYTWRGVTRRLISARRSRANEEEAYAEALEATQEQD